MLALTVDDAEKLRAEAQSEVDAAVEFAKKSPLPKLKRRWKTSTRLHMHEAKRVSSFNRI